MRSLSVNKVVLAVMLFYEVGMRSRNVIFEKGDGEDKVTEC